MPTEFLLAAFENFYCRQDFAEFQFVLAAYLRSTGWDPKYTGYRCNYKIIECFGFGQRAGILKITSTIVYIGECFGNGMATYPLQWDGYTPLCKPS